MALQQALSIQTEGLKQLAAADTLGVGAGIQGAGSGALSIDGNGQAITLTGAVNAAGLVTLSGSVDIDGSDPSIDATNSLSIGLAANSADDKSIGITASNAGAGDGILALNADTLNLTGIVGISGVLGVSGNVNAEAGLDVTGAALTVDSQAITGTALTDVDLAMGAGSPFEIHLNNDADGAFVVDAGGVDYIRVNNQTDAIIFGNATDNPLFTQLGSGQVSFAGNVDAAAGLDVTTNALTAAAALTVTGGAFTFSGSNIDLDPTGTFDLAMDAGQMIGIDLSDNLGPAFSMGQDVNNYLAIDTVNGSEQFTFGNATTNPDYNFFGSGTVDVAGALVVDGNVTLGTNTNNDVEVNGLITTDLTFENNGRGIGVLDADAGVGGTFAIESGAGAAGVDDTSAGGAGGSLDLTAGQGGAGALNQNGGAGANLVLDAGAGGAIGSGTSVAGTDGVVQLGVTNASAITIGQTGVTTTVAGDLSVSGIETVVGSTTFQDNVQFGDAAADEMNFVGVLVNNLVFKESLAHNISLTSANLTLQTVTSGNLVLQSAATLDVNCAMFDVDATGVVTIDGVGNSSLTIDNGALDLSTTTAGDITLSPVDSLNLPQYVKFNDSGSGYVATTSTTLAADLNTLTDGSNADSLHGHAAGGTLTKTAGEAISAGAPVCIQDDAGTPKLYHGDADGTGRRQDAYAIAPSSITSGNPGDYQLSGQVSIPDAIWDALPAVTDVGKRVYLSATVGKLTITPPSPSGGVRLRMGYVAVGGGGAVKMDISVGEPMSFA